jgi:asparagine synthase (glutamine-hydrolysing)
METRVNVHKYWRWDVSTPIRYSSDGEYEEHFRHELLRSVKRRLQSDYPVMAELSGGIDSSSIVCAADHILDSEGAGTPALHTLSYYHDQEPSCDERPYFSVIERKRRRVGTHINSARYESLTIDMPRFVPVPIYPHGIFDSEREMWEAMQGVSARRVLSGFGGDEFLGGVPTGIPELADLLRALEFTNFKSGVARWSSANRMSRWELIHPSLKAALTFQARDVSIFTNRRTSLIASTLNKSSKAGRSDRADHRKCLGMFATPTQRMFVEAWASLQRQLGYMRLPLYGSYERTYPYLDRDLLSFLINIPRTQIIRAGERRSLMRRSLGSLVPQEILWRKNKATGVRRYMRVFSQYSTDIKASVLGPTSFLYQRQYVDPTRADMALAQACNGIASYNFPVMRMIGLYSWLKVSEDYISYPERFRGGPRDVSPGTEEIITNLEHRIT